MRMTKRQIMRVCVPERERERERGGGTFKLRCKIVDKNRWKTYIKRERKKKGR